MKVRSEHGATPTTLALRTPICERIGIDYPVFQAGMGWVARAELAAAVSEAGGLGVIGAGTDMAADELRRQIEATRRLTDRPFGVDILFGTVRAAGSEVARYTDAVQEMVRVVLEERVPVLISGLGSPADAVPEAHARGIFVMSVVGGRSARGEGGGGRGGRRDRVRQRRRRPCRQDRHGGADSGGRRRRRRTGAGRRRAGRRPGVGGGAGAGGAGRLDGYPVCRQRGGARPRQLQEQDRGHLRSGHRGHARPQRQAVPHDPQSVHRLGGRRGRTRSSPIRCRRCTSATPPPHSAATAATPTTGCCPPGRAPA